MRRLFAAALSTWLASAATTFAEKAPQRPFQIDDMFELEGIGKYYGGPVSISADGRALAFTRLRPKKTLRNYKMEYLWGNDRGDVWVQRAPGENAVRITKGAEEGAGYWAPEWSPDGTRLAMLSTKGGNVTLWVWSANALRQLTTRGVNYIPGHYRPFQWVDATHLLCPLLPEGEQPPGMSVELQTPRIASAAWQKTPKGVEPTASVLQSGVPVDFTRRPQGQLVLIDVRSGETRVVGEGSARGINLAPNHGSVAYCRQVSLFTPKADEAVPRSIRGTYSVEVRSLQGVNLAEGVPLPRDVQPETLRWSLDGQQLAFIAHEGSRDGSPGLYQYHLASRTLATLPLGRLDVTPMDRTSRNALPPRLHWVDAGRLVIQAIEREPGKPRTPSSRSDWWLIGKEGEPVCLTRALKAAPEDLWPEHEFRSFVGVADGAIWRVNPGKASLENLTQGFDRQIAQISWPYYSNSGYHEYPARDQTYRQVVFATRNGGNLDRYRLRLDDRTITPLAAPSADAFLVAHSAKSGALVHTADNRNGTHLWRSAVDSDRHETLLEANTFLGGIAEAELKPIDYTSLNGEPLKAWIMLPYGYEPGRRYPMITWVYAGYVPGSSPPAESISRISSLSKQIPAARGYAVLIPSMPLPLRGEVDDPLLKLTHGVLPAVEKAIAEGIADPERVFLLGQSFGGYSVYGLVTQTNRFKAAVSLAGLANLISLYSAFDARERYTEYPHEWLFNFGIAESGQWLMGNPPWKDLGRFLRNSPIFYVDRVQTPVMIIQGDLDYVAIQQGEEFFMSLYRQGKRAEFVRYWGEGHVLESPANIRDMWRRIFAWFEEFSPKPGVTATSAAR